MQPNVLIVDDEAVFAKTLAERLSFRDCQVNIALNGNDAIDLIAKKNIDVVILDLAMPGIDGIETLKEIKRIKPLTEVIMLTGNATVETAIEGLKVGAMDYLIKPCETEALAELINMAYKRKSTQKNRLRTPS
jgi:DNA-binding NtrC family response regulator